MAYEYSSEKATLDFPNPYRIENILWAVRASFMLVCAVALVFLARKHLVAQSMGSFLVPIGLGILLMVLAIWNFVEIGQQLRVFFGRGQPVGLAPELEADQVGISEQAKALMQTVRQGALEFAIPSGALNGVLYSLVQDLITAPAYVQNVLQNRFANLASYLFMLLIMGVSMLFVMGDALQGWVGLFFLGLVVFMAVKPISGSGVQAKVSFNIIQVVMLVLVSILGPVALGFVQHRLPNLGWSWFGSQAFIILFALALIEAVFFVAVKKQIDPPPPVSKVDTQDAFSFNSDPNLLMQELEREMQKGWIHAIPNRRYSRVLPNIALNQRAGNFKGQLLEESQPMAPAAFSVLDWSVVRAYPRFFWLMLIDLLGVLLTLVGTTCLVIFAVQFNPLQDWRPVLGLATLGMSLVAVGGYAFRSAHTLWGRFDFESILTWVDLEGSFVRSKIDVGNRLQDRLFTERDVVNVESMTIRVWVMTIRSVVFGHQSHGSVTPRIITGMLSKPNDAGYIKNLIRQFAQQQSIIVAPTSPQDAQRLGAMASLNTLNPQSNPAAALMGAMASVSGLADQRQHESKPETVAASLSSTQKCFCTSCGHGNLFGNRFCEACGQTL